MPRATAGLLPVFTGQFSCARCSGLTRPRRIALIGGNFVFPWTSYSSGERWNIVFDIAPAEGSRIIMDGMPGLIHSGDDFGQASRIRLAEGHAARHELARLDEVHREVAAGHFVAAP